MPLYFWFWFLALFLFVSLDTVCNVSLPACVSIFSMCSPLFPHTHCNILWKQKLFHACMHALCSPFNIMQYNKWTLWTVINGYLPLAIERTVHLLEKTRRGCLSKMVLFYWVLGIWSFLAVALNSYSPNLEKMAQCSMITPLIFPQTVTKTTSRGHILLGGKICIVRYCFLWKYMEDL